MLKYDIKINLDLDVKVKEQVKLRYLVDKFVKDNEITSLYKIIFTDNWSKELLNIKENIIYLSSIQIQSMIQQWLKL